jgi:hypothetical protein
MVFIEPHKGEVSILDGINISSTTLISSAVFQALENPGLNTHYL